MKRVKITDVREYNNPDHKTKYLFDGGHFKTFNKLKVGQMVSLSEHKKGDEYKDHQGKVVGKYENDFLKFEGAGEQTMSLAKQQELEFLHKLSQQTEA